SREFEDLVKTVSSCYLDSSSRGTFTYCKARLIRNELLEKEFIEKRREMKQEGRTEQELSESFCFLYPDKTKLQWICEKGLAVGHSRITTLGNPSVGVYLSKYSDLLQINPFEVGSYGDMIIFKVMRGRVKHIHENMPKNAIEPSPKFDSHLSKSANRVTSPLSYRAFELTQQYFFEFAFDEIKARPRHVCPYAVVSFQYKGKEAAVAPMTANSRFNTLPSEASRGKSCYTVWSGPLVNKGQELFPVFLRSSTRPYLPFKLPEKLEVSQGMQLEQVKRKIPSVLFSWDTYSASREVMKCGMSCSLFEVVDGKGKPTSGSLAALVNKLERDRMVLVKSLHDRGFLFLLSSAQMVESKERWGRLEKSLQALFIFQESRMVVKYPSRLCEPAPLTAEPQPSTLTYMEPFIPALHYALFKLRPNPGKDLSSGVERQSTDYLTRMDSGTVRPFILPDYKCNMDDRTSPLQISRPKFNMDSMLRAYIHNHASYILPLNKVKEIIERIRNPAPVASTAPAAVEYSPVSDWGGSDRGSDRGDRPPEKVPQERPQQNEYDKDKMKQLLKLIQQHKKALVKDPGKDRGEDGSWDANRLKRKFEGDEKGGANKHQRLDPICNGESSRAVMESMGIYDTDLRTHGNYLSPVCHKGVLEKSWQQRVQPTDVSRKQQQKKHLVEFLPYHECDNQSRQAPDLECLIKLQAQHTQQRHLIFLTDGKQALTEIPSSAAEMHQGNHRLHLALLPQKILDSPVILITPNPSQYQCNPCSLQGFVLRSLVFHYLRIVPGKLGEAALTQPVQLSWADNPQITRTAAYKSKSKRKSQSQPPPKLRLSQNEYDKDKMKQLLKLIQQHKKALGSSQHLEHTSEDPPWVNPANEEGAQLFPELEPKSEPVLVPAPEVLTAPDGHPEPKTSAGVEYVSPIPCQSHVKTLCERMERLIPPLPISSDVTSPVPSVTTSSLATPPSTPNQSSKTKPEPSASKSVSCSHSGKTAPVKETKPTEGENRSPSNRVGGRDLLTLSSPPRHFRIQRPKRSDSGLLAGSLIGQLKPEVFSSLVEIFKDVTKNTVKFYIYSGDEWEQSDVCKDIKEYLKSLGNSECSPQTFLENSSSLDKLLIIIKNEDIAAHVHKIPALVSLKKLPSVSFAGVDSLDDVKNHTYNELFVSGGFIVSDEFVLNPDLITQDRLQGLLKFLEEQSTPEQPWHWKVHCKSQKKLKELGRLNTNAMGLLNLLTAYQKKHLVEFLPYHECDNQSRQAPDLECLIKLQAQHTQQRHLIFLTERPFEMFLQYSRNGIVIGSIDDVMSGF
uniref:Transcription activation suppressor b n=1 Tax=Tetraodon nigroviridis TaxID=99883 RepID=H3DKJ6_TETNG